MDEKAREFWTGVYEGHRRTLRFLAGMVLLLFVVGLFDGLENYDRLGEAYQTAVDVIVAEQRGGRLRDEIRAHIEREGIVRPSSGAPAPDGSGPAARTVVTLEELPSLYREFTRAYEANTDEEYRIGDQTVTLHAFVLAMLFGPLLLLAAMAWPLVAMRKLHRRLAPSAEADGPLQQKLNSLFFSRVTSRYGEGWHRHVLSCLLGLLLFAVATPFIFTSTHSIVRPDLRLYVTGSGEVAPLDSDPKISHLVIASDTGDSGLFLILGLLTVAATVLVARLSLSLPKPRDQASGGRDDAREGDAPTPP